MAAYLRSCAVAARPDPASFLRAVRAGGRVVYSAAGFSASAPLPFASLLAAGLQSCARKRLCHRTDRWKRSSKAARVALIALAWDQGKARGNKILIAGVKSRSILLRGRVMSKTRHGQRRFVFTGTDSSPRAAASGAQIAAIHARCRVVHHSSCLAGLPNCEWGD